MRKLDKASPFTDFYIYIYIYITLLRKGKKRR